MRILSVGRAFPSHRVDQSTVTQTLGRLWADPERNTEAVVRLQRASRVETRHLVLPVQAYLEHRSFGEANDLFVAEAASLCEVAIRDALSRARLQPADVDLIMLVSTSGVSTPSLDVRLVNRLRLRPDVRRLPIFGLGCVGGAAGLARCGDYLRGYPDAVALLVAVELCSLTFQRDDASTANLVATGLFGDGAAAVVIAGAQHARATTEALPRLIASRSLLYPDTEDVLGWRIGDNGFRVVLRTDLPDVACRSLRSDLCTFLSHHGLTLGDVGVWAVHPGGPRVLQGVADALDLPPAALRPSWESLRAFGNVSSVSVLLILSDLMENPPVRGTHGVLLGMGPGFSIESLLLDWA